jgi:hypothetical protein
VALAVEGVKTESLQVDLELPIRALLVVMALMQVLMVAVVAVELD